MDGAGEEKKWNHLVLQEFSQITITMKYLNRVEISWIDLKREKKNHFRAQIQLRKVQMAFKAIDYGICGVYEYENCESKCLQCEMRRILTSTQHRHN